MQNTNGLNIRCKCNRLYGTPAVRLSVLRLAWYTADSIRRFDSKTNRTADSIRDSIRTKRDDSQVPKCEVYWLKRSKRGKIDSL